MYSDSTAVVGPLATVSEPHSWDLCEVHGSRITAPKGWEMVRYEGSFGAAPSDDDDLTALAEAVREAHGAARPAAAPVPVGMEPHPATLPSARSNRTGRRGHLRVLPDPTN